MTEADQLKALADPIEASLSGSVPLRRVVSPDALELFYTFNDGTECKIRISIVTNQDRAGEAQKLFDQRKLDRVWAENALKPGSPEAAELAEYQRRIALGRV